MTRREHCTRVVASRHSVYDPGVSGESPGVTPDAGTAGSSHSPASCVWRCTVKFAFITPALAFVPHWKVLSNCQFSHRCTNHAKELTELDSASLSASDLRARLLDCLTLLYFYLKLKELLKKGRYTSFRSTQNDCDYMFEVKWSEVAQSCPTLCDPMDSSLPGSAIHGIFQARVLEWAAISFSMFRALYTLIKPHKSLFN